MKQESKKQPKKWLWIVIAVVAVLAIAGTILAIFLGQGEQNPQGDATSAELYWNIDRNTYLNEETGMSDRTPEANGLYKVRFAANGKQVELEIADKRLINYIDTMDVVGLVFGADGTVVDAVSPRDVALELGNHYYIQRITADGFTMNSTIVMNGMEVPVKLPAENVIYNVDPYSAEVIGENAAADSLSVMDLVSVYADEERNVTHVFLVERAPEAELYWRIEKLTANGVTSRVPDENGVYTVECAKDGHLVDLKFKDINLVNYVDVELSALGAEFGVQFDQEGYVNRVVDASVTLRGKKLLNDWHVTAINGNEITATKLSPGGEQGSVYTFTIPEDCPMYMCCGGCYHENMGEIITELRVEDRFNMYTDMDDNPILINVTRRCVDSPMYYHKYYQYDSTTRQSSRIPDADGYYVYDLVSEGKQVTVKTKDKELARKIDCRTEHCIGLKLKGNIVLEVYHPRCVAGDSFLSMSKVVTNVAGSVFQVADPSNLAAPSTGVMAPGCKIYDVTYHMNGVKPGKITDLRVGDTITCSRNIWGEIEEIFVENRYVKGLKVYWSTGRRWDAATQGTSRTPVADGDDEGYYVFETVCDGKLTTVKTKSKEMADFMDLQNSPVFALKVDKDGVVKEAYEVTCAFLYGYKTANNNLINEIDGNMFTTYYYNANNERRENSKVQALASDCIIYNVSGVVRDHIGEKTKLQPDDKIQAIADGSTNQCVMIFVREREVDSPLYWNCRPQFDGTQTTRTPNKDGYYEVELLVNGKFKTFKTKSIDLMSKVDSYGYSSEGIAMETKGDVILGVYVGNASRSVYQKDVGYYDVMGIKGNTVTYTRNQPNGTNYGRTIEVEMAKGYKVYDVSPYAKKMGEQTKLGLGDRVVAYSSESGKVDTVFILYKHTREEGHVSYCEHCNKEVFWNPYNGVFGSMKDPVQHFYVTHDGYINSSPTISASYDIVLDLNGNTLQTYGRGFTVRGKMTVVDSVGGGGINADNQTQAFGGVFFTTGEATLNIYAGNFTVSKNATTARGGIACVSYGCTFNMYGGKIFGGTSTSIGDNVVVMGSGTFNMYGGTIDGGVEAQGGATVFLSGKAQIPMGANYGLKLADGVLLKLGKLENPAKFVIKAKGIFTDTLENASSYLKYFTPVRAEDSIEANEENNALHYNKAYTVIDNSNLVFAEGSTSAYCPVCDQTVVWAPLVAGETTVTMTNGHFYLTEDMVYEGADVAFQAPSGVPACIHLNGHNITAPNSKVFQGDSGTLNVMGNGIVSGNWVNPELASDGSTVAINTINVSGSVNLYGGTYVAPENNPQTSIISINNNGGKINLYEGAIVEAGNKLHAIHIGNANRNHALFTITGSTINGAINIIGANGSNPCNLTVNGGTITDGIVVGATADVTLSGAIVIGGKGVQIPEGKTINLGTLTEGASITVRANGEFISGLTNADTYISYFVPAKEGDTITANNDNSGLVYTKNSGIDNSNLVFAEGTTNAMCPLCEKTVTWTAFVPGETTTTLDANTHYYLASDITYESADTMMKANGVSCFHLNGHNITATKAIVVEGNSSTMNIMGNGTVAGGYTSGSTIYTNRNIASGAINLHGGTYASTANGAQTVVIMINNNGGKINLYQGATVQGNAGVAAINVGCSNLTDAMLNITGATVNGSIAIAAPAKTNVSGIVVNGGTITDGIVFAAGSDVTLNGAPVIGGKGVQIPEGKTINLGTLTEGASITVKANGEFISGLTDAASLISYFVPAKEGDTITANNDNSGLIYNKTPGIDNSDLVFEPNTTNAMCPLCETVVTWKAFEAGSSTVTLDANTHYYLTGDVTYEGTTSMMKANGVSCFHLNGHNITATRFLVVEGNSSTMNIMGNGTVAGGYTDGSTIYTNRSADSGLINLYGGTYTSTANGAQTEVVKIHNNGGKINLYQGATVQGNPGAHAISVGCSNRTDAMLNIIGATVNGSISVAAPAKTYSTGITVDGGTITGGVILGANVNITLEGAPVITGGSGLNLPAGTTITLGKLKEGASIAVNASGIFTAANENAADYVDFFLAPEGYDIVCGTDNCLSCVAEG